MGHCVTLLKLHGKITTCVYDNVCIIRHLLKFLIVYHYFGSAGAASVGIVIGSIDESVKKAEHFQTN